MDDHELRPAALPTWKQRLALRTLNAFGWRLNYQPLPGPHGVAVVYPHTSNWDFFVGLLGKWALGLPFRWLAKDALFRGPLGVVMRHLGGIAVDRRTTTGATAQLAKVMTASDWCWIGITPEGTRGYKPHWRTGFYHLALTAKVPVLLVYMDYPNKVLDLTNSITLSGDQALDMASIAAVYAGHEGLHPELAAPIVLAPPRPRE
jgi:1-acyl-sn-glycerol-3-phosphate acyltransferase